MKLSKLRKLWHLTPLTCAGLAATWPMILLGQQATSPLDGKTEPVIKLAGQTGQPVQPVQPPQIDPTTPDLTSPEPPRTQQSLAILGLGAPSTTSGQTNVSGSTAISSGSAGDLLSSAGGGTGVEVQRRSPIAVDPRIRGYHVGQIVNIADGAFWSPARVDLDAAIGKINPDNIRNIAVIKGPYAARYGPGLSFLDIQTFDTPRYKDGFEAHGTTSLQFRTNGLGWTARQYLWGGGCDFGFRLGYDILGANDYYLGDGSRIPTSYNAQNVDFAFGVDLTEHSKIEIRYLRQMQNDVEFPGLLTDINQLNTDGVTARYSVEHGAWFDRLTVDGWYNTTNFNGDSSRPGKRRQIPQLKNILAAPNANNQNGAFFAAVGGPVEVRLDLATEGDQYSWGARPAITWGESKGVQLTFGSDISVVRQAYNEIDTFNFSVSETSNLNIPASQSIDPGVFVEGQLPIGERLMVRAGARADFISTRIQRFGPGVDTAEYLAILGPEALKSQQFILGSAFATADYQIVEDHLTASVAYGFGQRPPTLTELYAGGPFFGVVQNGFNAIYGDPTLRQEQAHQFDVGLNANYDCFRGGVAGFVSLVNNYINFQSGPFTSAGGQVVPSNFLIGPVEFPDNSGDLYDLQTVIRNYRYVNTSRARLMGFEAFGEYDVLPWLTPFASVSYVHGQDLGTNESLPGISPLEGRAGIRLHDSNMKNPRWGLEGSARMVAAQDRFAISLGEQPTPGFVVFDARAFWQVRDNMLLLAGAQNIGDRVYQEHLDLRTGLGVYQPGLNIYCGMRINY